MKKIIVCDLEKEVLRAFDAGSISGTLQEHLGQCTSCRSAVSIVKGIHKLKASAMQKAATPNVHWIMLQAQWREEERLLKRFTLANRLGAFAGIVLSVGMTSFLLQQYPHARPVLSDEYVSIVVPVIVCVLLSEILFKNIHKTAKGKV